MFLNGEALSNRPMEFMDNPPEAWITCAQNTLELGKHQNRIVYTEILPECQLANALGYERLIREALRRR
jgi:hypothetical protein